MSDFFTRQAERALGVAHAIEPLLASRFAESAFAEGEPGFQEVHAEVEGGRETSRAFHHAAPRAGLPRTSAPSPHAGASLAAAGPAASSVAASTLSPVPPSAPVLRRLVDTGDGSRVAASDVANPVDFGRAAGQSATVRGNTPREMEPTDRDRAAGSRDQESADLYQNFAEVRQPSAALHHDSAKIDEGTADVHPGRADRDHGSSDRDWTAVDHARGAQDRAGASENRVRGSVDDGHASAERLYSDALLMEAAPDGGMRDAAPARSAVDREYGLHADSATEADSRSGFSPRGGFERAASEPNRASEDDRRGADGSVAAESGGGLLVPPDRDPEMHGRRAEGSPASGGSTIQSISRGAGAVDAIAAGAEGARAGAGLRGSSAEDQEFASRARVETPTRSGERVSAIRGTDSGGTAGSSSGEEPFPQSIASEHPSAALLMPAEHGTEPARLRAGARGVETDSVSGSADERNAVLRGAQSGPVPRSGSASVDVERSGPAPRFAAAASAGLEQSGGKTHTGSAAARVERAGSGTRSGVASARLERSGLEAQSRPASGDAGQQRSGSSVEAKYAAEAGAARASRVGRDTTVAEDSGLLLPPTRRARQAEGAAARGAKTGASQDHAGDGSSSTQRAAVNPLPGRKPDAEAGRTLVPPAPGRQQSPVARNPEPASPVVTVSIGRIEVRAAPAPAPEPVVQPAAQGWRAPVLSLDDYLEKGGR